MVACLGSTDAYEEEQLELSALRRVWSYSAVGIERFPPETFQRIIYGTEDVSTRQLPAQRA